MSAPQSTTPPQLRRHLKAVVVCPGVFAVLLPSVFLTLAEVVAQIWPAAEIAALHPAPRVAGFVLLLAGGVLFAWTNVLFHRGNGTLHPNDGPTRLVTTGPYAWTRNPMIIGVMLILGGAATLLGSWTLVGYLALFMIAKNIYIAKHEEPTLRESFGSLYHHYLEQVPRRWLPWPPSKQATADV